MIPLWMMPLALVAGNTMLLKPSEQDPGATLMLVELAKVWFCLISNLVF
jgi:malonate-semialdehyde dehydrogenase (acetylating) / methylmalonate-semialdehyde dehydrogenase